jgi:hypothetical protein
VGRVRVCLVLTATIEFPVDRSVLRSWPRNTSSRSMLDTSGVVDAGGDPAHRQRSMDRRSEPQGCDFLWADDGLGTGCRSEAALLPGKDALTLRSVAACRRTRNLEAQLKL